MLLQHDHYRAYLKAELGERVSANPAYSLRAFAQGLGLSCSFLSEVLQGKKNLSAGAAMKVAMRLGLNEVETRYFCLLSRLECEDDPREKESILAKIREINPRRSVQELSVDVFRAIADWYHFAILELTGVSDFTLTPASAARQLGISIHEAAAAIERLQRLELLEEGPRGRLAKAKDHFIASSAVPNAALKSFHRQALAKASAAVLEQPPESRVSSTDLVAIDSRYVEEVRKLSDRFTEDLIKLTDRSKRRDRVFCLSVHFFPLSSERKPK
jgi:uncharacterized protein (TIGR02147 family)